MEKDRGGNFPNDDDDDPVARVAYIYITRLPKSKSLCNY